MAGSVRRTADGWIADVCINGSRRTAKRKTKAEALEAKRQLLELLVARTAGKPQGITITDARELSLRIRWAGKAFQRTASIYSQAAVDHFGPLAQMDSITAPAVEEWRQRLLQGGNRPGTVNAKVSCLRAMFSDAVLHGYLAAIPPLPKQLTNRNAKNRTFSDAEAAAFCDRFRSAGHPAAADLFVFLLESCCRWGEAEKLRGADVDLERRRVSFWETKNGRARSVPLTRRALDALAPHLPAVPSHRVWPYTYGQFKWLFQGAKDALGIEDEALTIHCTRHTCASRLATSGVPLHQLMAFGGWTSLQSVQRYLHLHTEALASCVAALEG
jgi:integrase